MIYDIIEYIIVDKVIRLYSRFQLKVLEEVPTEAL